jgi:ectoine hydroxylase-related dioxygenase (phytanoyl-CoA dioxygenase family)
MTSESLHVNFANRPLKDAMVDAKQLYERNGCFLAKGLFDPAEFDSTKQDISALIDALFAESGQERPRGPGFDSGMMELAKIDRGYVGRVFDAGRRLLPVHEMSVDSRLITIAKTLMGAEVVSASDIKAVRVDLPNEDKYLFDWHQDYPYVMDSFDAVVFWIPLQDVDETNGCLSVLPGSHSQGLRKLTLVDPDNKNNNKQKMMKIAGVQDIVAASEKVKVPVKLGDVLVFSTLLLHASGPNVSDRARFTLQVRFGNFLHPVAVKKGWPGSMRDGSVFHEKHPEYVA